ncbi:uncharacterized protein LOC143036367 isoform X2 [Oratosquilla oratoria]|uniref:uncharacterized protein LOC143036367 isoform X2 n=1 Tax=Oratosquilla oratoria TaxID=337810 RepID=UPI003F75BB11
MSLGKLSKSQIAKGLKCLLDIEEAIENKKGQQELKDLSSLYYTNVPQDCGRKAPPIIDTLEIVQQKKELLVNMQQGCKRAAQAPAPVVKEEPEEEEEEPPAKRQKELGETSKLPKAIETVKQEGTTKKTVSPDESLARLYEGVEVREDFACILSLTNIDDNQNKFYIMQVAKAGKNYVYFTKWGRIGEPGRHDVKGGLTENKAIAAFKKKFKDKTRNDWDKRDNFEAKRGKYTLIEIGE